MKGRAEIVTGTVFIVLILMAFSLVFMEPVRGTMGTENRALIIVSTYEANSVEDGKANSFHDHLISEGYSESEIEVLGPASLSGYDRSSNISNVEEAFEHLTSEGPLDGVVIYISDHEQYIQGNVSFRFSDGNITTSAIDVWIDSTTYQDLTMILGGNRSALAGPDLVDDSREVLCSMGSTQSFEEDLFNITRGLKDPSADLNSDGEVSYHEGFLKEYDNLEFEDQTPEYYWG